MSPREITPTSIESLNNIDTDDILESYNRLWKG